MAGDLFHHWRATPELINWMITYTPPRVYAVAGNHDLPYHDLGLIKKSAYWTLVGAGVVTNLAPPNTPIIVEAGNPEGDLLWVTGFPWGTPPSSVPLPDDEEDPDGTALDLVIVHDYCWQTNHGDYPGVDQDKHFRKHMEYLGGHDVMAFGDNHQPFMHEAQGQGILVNCGAMIPRRSDEKHAGYVYIVYHTGDVARHQLHDPGTWIVPKDDFGLAEHGVDLEAAVDLLQRLAATTMDFGEAVKEYLQGPGRGLSRAVAGLVAGLVEKAREVKQK